MCIETATQSAPPPSYGARAMHFRFDPNFPFHAFSAQIEEEEFHPDTRSPARTSCVRFLIKVMPKNKDAIHPLSITIHELLNPWNEFYV